MMKHLSASLRTLLAAGCLLGFATGCGDDGDADDEAVLGPDGFSAGPGAYSSDFLTSADFYTPMNGLVEGDSPHGWYQVWFSSNIRELVEAEAGRIEVPEGTVAIKEFDKNNDGTDTGYAVMVKREAGYDPDGSDWYYEMRDPEGNLLDTPAPGPVQICIECHDDYPGLDYLPSIGLLP